MTLARASLNQSYGTKAHVTLLIMDSVISEQYSTVIILLLQGWRVQRLEGTDLLGLLLLEESIDYGTKS